jgi:hypothetical protein
MSCSVSIAAPGEIEAALEALMASLPFSLDLGTVGAAPGSSERP